MASRSTPASWRYTGTADSWLIIFLRLDRRICLTTVAHGCREVQTGGHMLAPKPVLALGNEGCPTPRQARPGGHDKMMLTQDEEADLRELSWHWDEAYAFRVTDGVWTA